MSNAELRKPVEDDVDDDDGTSKGRGPAYPYLDLPKALERVGQMVGKGLSSKHAVSPAAIYQYWQLGSKSSAARQSMAALKYYGLVEYIGTGKDRRVRLTDRAMVLAHDKDAASQRRRTALRDAALEPAIFRDIYTEKGGPFLPGDDVLALDLTLEKGFDRESADRAVKHFRSTIVLAGLDKPDDSLEKPSNTDSNSGKDNVKFGGARVGDLVQWESQGVLQLEAPRRVRAIHDDGEWLWVEGSETAVPMNEAIVIQAIPAGRTPPPPPPLQPQSATHGARSGAALPVSGEMKIDTFATSDGDVTFQWPKTLSQESLEDIETWTTLILKKIKREIQKPKSNDEAAE